MYMQLSVVYNSAWKLWQHIQHKQ